MTITHAQPLMPEDKTGQLEPRPLLSPAQAEVEASALYVEDVLGFHTEALQNVPAECFSHATQAMLKLWPLNLYTHLANPYGSTTDADTPERLCRDYLVRIET